MSFWIVTDVGSDMSMDFYKRYGNLRVLPMPYRMDGVEKQYHVEDEADLKGFYRDLRAEKVATTAQVTVDAAVACFEELVDKGEILYIGLSGGISGTVQSVETAKNMVLEKYPSARITVVDSLLASAGLVLLVYYALTLRDEGRSYDETVKWVIDHRQNINSWFTVDDLDFLFRGGRVNRVTAIFGSMMRIKPVMHVNFDGKLIPKDKVQGRKKSIKALAEKVIERATPRDQTVFISHGDCLEDAEYLAQTLKKNMPEIKNIEMFTLGTIIGAHAGPGTVAVFFMGENRQ